jgi:hypothetical protein
MKTFDNEWMLEAFAGRSTFFTKRMFGGLAAYLHGRLMLVLVEPTKTGRWKWHGVLVGTDHTHHASIRADFPALAPHGFLRKWLYIDSADRNFESTVEAVAQRMVSNDRRFGVAPRARPLHRPTNSALHRPAKPGLDRPAKRGLDRPAKRDRTDPRKKDRTMG